MAVAHEFQAINFCDSEIVCKFAITIPWLMTTDSLTAGAGLWSAVRFFRGGVEISKQELLDGIGEIA